MPNDHNLLLASDFHEGTVASHHNARKKLISRVKREKDTYIALGGDLAEAITVDDKRYSVQTATQATPGQQLDVLFKELDPIAHKIKFILTGNHEMKWLRVFDLTERLCQDLSVPYGGFSTKFTAKYSNGRPMYKLYYTHGRLRVASGADDPIRQLSNQKLQVKRKLMPLAGDCVIMATAHAHKLIVAEPEHMLYLTDDEQTGEIKQNYTGARQHDAYIPGHLRWYCCTGSFLKTFVKGTSVTYSEAAMYAPTEIGYVEIQVRNGTITRVFPVIL
jgi:hypothetical protein